MEPDTPDNTLSSHRPSLTRKNHFSSDLGTNLSSTFCYSVVCIADCDTPALLVTVEEPAELEVCGALVSAGTKD